MSRSWWQWSPRAWSWAGAAQDDQPQQQSSAASWSWAAARARTLTPRRSFDGPAGAAGPTGTWARYQGGRASPPQTTGLQQPEPGQGANRARRVGNARRLLRNYVRVMWRKVQDEYQGCLKNAEIFDIQSWAEKFLSYQAYLERHDEGHKASSNLGHTPPRTLSVGECSEHSWAATAPTGNLPIQQFTHIILYDNG